MKYEVEDLNEDIEMDEDELYPRKKEGFFKRHAFLLGILACLTCIILAGGVVHKILERTGQILILGESGASVINGEAILDDEVVDKIDEIYSYMNIYYYEDFDKEAIYQSMYEGVLKSLGDPYSVYYTPEKYQDLMVDTSGVYYGIGAGVSQNLETMQVTITKVYRGTPSEDAGLKNGDILLYVEDIDATSMEVSELVKHIRGEEGTTVHLTIYREATGETLEFDVERRHVELPSIEGEMLDNGIAYIQITEFQSKTEEQFAEMAAVVAKYAK